MTKSSQVTLAREILTVLKIADPRSILAGGAVRDWYMLDIAGRDLDFYTSFQPHRNIDQIITFIKEDLKGTNVTVLGQQEMGDNYESMIGLKHVFEFIRDDQVCNLMIMEPCYMSNILKNFDLSVCKASFDGVEYYFDPDFLVTDATNICFVHKDVKVDAKHVRKIADRFPHMRFVRDLDVQRRTQDKALPKFEDTDDDIPW